MVYKGFYNDKEYIVYYDETYFSRSVIIRFPDKEKPIRVDYNNKSTSLGREMGQFQIPAEKHKKSDGKWTLFRQDNKMLITDSFGIFVFLYAVDEQHNELMKDFIDFPDDVFDHISFIEFDKLFIVKYFKKYHKTSKDYDPIIVIWNKETHSVEKVNITEHETFKDGGTFTARFYYNNIEHFLYVPSLFAQKKVAKLDEMFDGKLIEEKDDNYWEIWKKFKNDSGLKLYYIENFDN